MLRLILASLFLTAFMISPASAQAVCGKRDAIVKQLEAKYGETRRSVGVQQGRGVVEVYASEKTGSWTILLTNARGLSCLMAAGEAFESMIQVKPKGDPAHFHRTDARVEDPLAEPRQRLIHMALSNALAGSCDAYQLKDKEAFEAERQTLEALSERFPQMYAFFGTKAARWLLMRGRGIQSENAGMDGLVAFNAACKEAFEDESSEPMREWVEPVSE